MTTRNTQLGLDALHNLDNNKLCLYCASDQAMWVKINNDDTFELSPLQQDGNKTKANTTTKTKMKTTCLYSSKQCGQYCFTSSLHKVSTTEKMTTKTMCITITRTTQTTKTTATIAGCIVDKEQQQVEPTNKAMHQQQKMGCQTITQRVRPRTTKLHLLHFLSFVCEFASLFI